MCLQPRKSAVVLTPRNLAEVQREMNRYRGCKNGPRMKNLNDEELKEFEDIRSSCIHCIKGPYMTLSQNPETYAVAVAILDAVLAKLKTKSNLVSVIGVACLSIACKLTEDDENIPGLRELKETSGHGWSVNDLGRMEQYLLNKLDWEPPTVTYLTFLPLFARAYNLDPEMVTHERSILFAERCIRAQAAAYLKPPALALGLVQHMLGTEPTSLELPNELMDICDISMQDLVKCRQLLATVSDPGFKPRQLPSFCPKVRHGRKQFCRPSTKGSPKLRTIQEQI